MSVSSTAEPLTPLDMATGPTMSATNGLFIAAVVFAVVTPCIGMVAVGNNWKRKLVPWRWLQFIEIAANIAAFALALAALAEVRAAQRAGSHLLTALRDLEPFDPSQYSASSTSFESFDLCHEPGAVFCTHIQESPTVTWDTDPVMNFTSNASQSFYENKCGQVLWAGRKASNCCYSGPGEIESIHNTVDMTVTLRTYLTLSIILIVSDMVVTFRPLPHRASLSCFCCGLGLEFLVNVFMMAVLFPMLVLKSSIGRAGFDEPACISQGRPELRDRMETFEEAMIVALEGSLVETIVFACAQLAAAAFLFFGEEATDIFDDDDSSNGCCKRAYVVPQGMQTMTLNALTPSSRA
eukprot:m.293270 g.293270  ORF g.293270 m.293270 type:complete len:352 (-) comp19885_c0_seq1:199-1254(-)